ncbi:hypothetical protein AFLA_007557 [Aspergillus flavus NRRL3357]|nr:hypothetical protein AFLA_007557 [Aspergillus flavus NRRL3357]
MEDSKGNNWSLTSPDRTNHSSKQVDVQPACRMRNGGVESLNLRCPYKVITMAQSRDTRMEFIPSELTGDIPLETETRT